MKGPLNGRISPNLEHDIRERWTVNGQSGTATPPPRKLGMTSSELLPHVFNDCKYSKALPTFPWLQERVFCCSLAILKRRPSTFRHLTYSIADSRLPAEIRCVSGCELHIGAGIPANTTHMNAASICLGAEGVP